MTKKNCHSADTPLEMAMGEISVNPFLNLHTIAKKYAVNEKEIHDFAYDKRFEIINTERPLFVKYGDEQNCTSVYKWVAEKYGTSPQTVYNTINSSKMAKKRKTRAMIYNEITDEIRAEMMQNPWENYRAYIRKYGISFTAVREILNPERVRIIDELGDIPQKKKLDIICKKYSVSRDRVSNFMGRDKNGVSIDPDREYTDSTVFLIRKWYKELMETDYGKRRRVYTHDEAIRRIADVLNRSEESVKQAFNSKYDDDVKRCLKKAIECQANDENIASKPKK